MVKGTDPEITRMTRRRIFRDGKVPEELTRVRWGLFRPDAFDENDPAAVLTQQAFYYPSRPFLHHWAAEGIAEARQMCDMIGIEPNSLRRRIGMGDTIFKQLPCDPPMSLDHVQFHADFNAEKGWTICKPVVQNSNRKWVPFGEHSPNPKPDPTLS